MRDAARRDRVRERARDVLLADEILERLRPLLAGEDEVAHALSRLQCARAKCESGEALSATSSTREKRPLGTAHFSVWFGATLLMCLSPGPNVFTTLSFALSQGFARALRSVLGVAAASAVFLLVSALGVVAALAAASTAFFVVRVAGAMYLAYLGVRLLRAAAHPTGSTPPVKLTTRPFTQGFATHISNPKAILYWGALLPQFIDANRPLARQVTLLGSLGILIDVLVLASYAGLAAFARRKLDRPGVSRALHAVSGAFFVTTSVWLAIVSRRP